ncbi:unnamed protein product [Moneuplotes crassus]|uniref:TLC domain-containing protein n=1 Tax=Euplotes crassus TaxID=5936 RepID=A0AAD2CZZ1_EUPCR|nr:unnamed protein product [Moneuplotes crassus]
MGITENTCRSQLRKIYDVTTPSQFICMIISTVLLLYFPTIIESSKTYTRYRQLERPDYEVESVNDFWVIIPLGIFLRLAKMFVAYITKDFFMKKLYHKYKKGDLTQKVDKCIRGAFKVVYFSVVFYIGLFEVLNKTHFGPAITFGDGDHRLALGNFPFSPMPSMLKFYYMLSMSYYIEDVIVHLFQTPQFDFWEMILHHIIAFMLLLDSYMNGFWIFGVLILPQMDFEDIWIGLIRCVMDYSSSAVTMSIYSVILLSWIWLRFIAFGYVMLYSFCFTCRMSLDNDTRIIMFNNLLLWTLAGLNIYWFILLVKMGLGFLFKNKCVDMQAVQNLECDKIKRIQ